MLSLELREAVQLITLDRRDRSNSLHPDLIGELGRALERITADPAIRVVVLTGAGKSFCAGLDLKHLAELTADESVEYMRSAFRLFRQVYELRQPVIAAVNGPAYAGGFDLAAFCDIRLCGVDAKFAQTEILLGLTQIMYPVYKVFGLSRAKEMALTGRAVSADEAYRIGFVTHVYPQLELLPQALQLAEELARRPPQALFETKRLSRELIEMDTDSAMTRMFDVISSRLRSDEHRQALQTYLATLRSRRKQPNDPPTGRASESR